MSFERLARLVEFGVLNNMDSVLVTRHGRIVLEATYAPFRAGLKHRINSVTKAVISTLVGMALGRGPARQHRPAGRRSSSPTAPIANLDERQEGDHDPPSARHDIGPRLAGGPGWPMAPSSPWSAAPDWQQYVLDQPMATAPGTRLLLRQRQQPSPVGHPEQGHGPERPRLCAGEAVRAARHRRRDVAVRPAGHLDRRLGSLPAAARYGEDRLSLAARRPVGGQADPAGGVDRGRAPGRCRYARELGDATCATASSSGSMPQRNTFMAVG